MWAAAGTDGGALGPHIQEIVKSGADLNIKDKSGKTAIVIAQEAGNVQAAEYLKSMNNDLAHKQKVLERRKRKQEKEKKETGLSQAEQKRIEAERQRDEQEGQRLLKKLAEVLKALS